MGQGVVFRLYDAIEAISLKLAATLGRPRPDGAAGGSEHSEHSESAGVILVGGAVSEGFGIWF